MRVREPSTVSGYFSNLKQAARRVRNGNQKSPLSVYSSLNSSLLVKVHNTRQWGEFSGNYSMEERAHFSVLTFRDLRAEVRSIMYMNIISKIKPPLRKKPYIFESTARWVGAARQFLVLRQEILKSIGKGRHLEIQYEEWHGQSEERQLNVIRRLASGLGWPFTEADIRLALIEVSRLKPPPSNCLLIHPVTQLHNNHILTPVRHERINRAVKAGYQAIEQDPICRAFLKSANYL